MFKSNLQGLFFVMVLEAYISYLMCALVMLISSVFFLFFGIFLLLFAFFVLTCFFFLIPSKLNDDLMHLLWQGHTSIKHSFTHHLIYYSSKIHEKISQF